MGTVIEEEGAFSKVIIGNSYVYKIWVNDPAYEDWLRVCRNEENSWVPKLIGPIKLMKIFFKRNDQVPENPKDHYFPSTLKIQKIEKLATNPNENDSKIFANCISELIDTKFSISDLSKILMTELDNTEFNIDLIVSKADELYTIILAIRNLVKHEHNIDLHSQNFMMRGDQPVITDPIMNNGIIYLKDL